MKTKLKKDKVNVITLGCSKNTVDSEIMMGQLAANGIDVTLVVDVLEHSHLPDDIKNKLTNLMHVKQHAGKIKVVENKVKLTESALAKIIKAVGIDDKRKSS